MPKSVTPQVDFDSKVSLNCQFCSLGFEIPIRVDGKRITESNKIAVGISMATPLSRVVSGNQDFGCAGAFRCSRCYSVHVICAKYQAIEKKDEALDGLKSFIMQILWHQNQANLETMMQRIAILMMNLMLQLYEFNG